MFTDMHEQLCRTPKSFANDMRVAPMRAHPDLNQGPADLQSAALTTELCTHCFAESVLLGYDAGQSLGIDKCKAVLATRCLRLTPGICPRHGGSEICDFVFPRRGTRGSSRAGRLPSLNVVALRSGLPGCTSQTHANGNRGAANLRWHCQVCTTPTRQHAENKRSQPKA